MNLFRVFNQMKADECFRVRSKLIGRLQGRTCFTEEDINEILAYKGLEQHSNPDAKRITDKAFETPDLGEKFRLLKRLNGVGVILASTILTFQNPHKYAELDVNTWNQLRVNCGFKAAEKDTHSDYGIPEYLSYIDMLKSLADEYGMNPTDVQYVLSIDS
jgi:hypothetical protein